MLMDKQYLLNTSQLQSIFIFNAQTLVLNQTEHYNLSTWLIKNLKFKDNIFYGSRHGIRVLFKYLQKQLYRWHIGYCVMLELYGLSFTVTKKKNVLRLNIGYTHSVYYRIPADVIIGAKKKRIYVFSLSLFRLKFVVAELVNFRPLSSYKLKGIKNKDILYKKKKINLTK